MRHINYWLLALLATVILLQGGCSASTPAQVSGEKPATTEKIDGSEFNRVTLTEKAAQRIKLQTGKIREEEVGGKMRRVVPYSSIIYGLHGETWLYTSDTPLTFVRAPITVDYIEGDNVILIDGPALGPHGWPTTIARPKLTTQCMSQHSIPTAWSRPPSERAVRVICVDRQHDDVSAIRTNLIIDFFLGELIIK